MIRTSRRVWSRRSSQSEGRWRAGLEDITPVLVNAALEQLKKYVFSPEAENF